MGIDYLDIAFRIEKEFGVITRGKLDFSADPVEGRGRNQRSSVTAGALHDRVCDLLRAEGRAAPEDSWPRLQACISEALGVPLTEIRRESRLVKDLGAE